MKLTKICTVLGLAITMMDAFGQSAQSDAYRYAQEAYVAQAQGRYGDAESAARAALASGPDDVALGRLLVDALSHQGRDTDALEASKQLTTRFPQDRDALAQQGFLAQRLGDCTTALAVFDAALALPGWDKAEERNLRLAVADCALTSQQPQRALDAIAAYSANSDAAVEARRSAARQTIVATRSTASVDATPASDSLDRAYALVRAGDDRGALTQFEAGFAQGKGRARVYADAAYAAQRIGDNARAAALFRASLDANNSAPDDQRYDREQAYDYRRAIEQASRSIGAVVSVPYQAGGFSPQQTVDVLQPGTEIYWQPPYIGYVDGRIFQVFARQYSTLYDGSGGTTGLPTLQASVGARYKPFSTQNVMLTVERLIAVGRTAYDDWLVRLGYSTDAGTDLHPAIPSWRTWQFYTESAYFMKEGRLIQPFEARYGHSWRLDALDSQLVVFPHLAVAGDYDSRAAQRLALGVGPGVGLRYWFRSGAYSAPASWADLNVQYRLPLTSAARAKGLVVRLTLWF